ncbi:MAG: CheY-like chemotaxis protein [Flavobacteriales bacterium]|jgi:CheY-like chemotaxis protein
MSKKINCIALVDDDDVTNFLNKRLVETSNMFSHILTFSNGKEILDYMCTDDVIEPNLILLDINMPVMNGFDFLEHHKKLPISNKANMVIAMLTTSLLEKDRARAEQLEITEYVEKPLSFDKLKSLIDKHIDKFDL